MPWPGCQNDATRVEEEGEEEEEARREALHCNAEVILFDATPIVCDLEELEAATLGNYRDVG